MTTTVTYTYTCDLCKKPAMPEQSVQYVGTLPLPTPRATVNLGGFDVCGDCRNAFDEFMATRKTQAASV